MKNQLHDQQLLLQEEARLKEVKKRRKRLRKEVMNLIEAKEQKDIDAAEDGVIWAASEARSSKAERGLSGISGVGVNRKDSQGINEMWKKLCGTVEEEVLEKYTK